MNRSAVWILVICCVLMVCSAFTLNAQNNPVIEKGAPQSNNTLPSGGTLGSNSGVNPMGNPGTIINNSGNSSSINNTLTAHPNIEPGTYLNSSPEGTVITTTVSTGTVTQQTASVNTSNSSGTVASGIRDSAGSTVKNNVHVKDIAIKEPVRTTKKPDVDVVKTPAKNDAPKVMAKTKVIPAYTPVRGNFVSEQTIANIKTKYGPSIYDIRTVKIASTSKIAYIVRIVEDGKLRSELFYDEQ